jgi:hypothetical protein
LNEIATTSRLLTITGWVTIAASAPLAWLIQQQHGSGWDPLVVSGGVIAFGLVTLHTGARGVVITGGRITTRRMFGLRAKTYEVSQVLGFSRYVTASKRPVWRLKVFFDDDTSIEVSIGYGGTLPLISGADPVGDWLGSHGVPNMSP